MKRLALLALAACGTLVLTGCFNPFSPLVSRIGGISSPAPVPNSPANVIKLHEWCWANRAIDEYKEIFTDDYVFVFATGDSAGNAYRDRPFIREDDLIVAQNMFVGGGERPPANSISINYDPNLATFPDLRPGKTNKWHKTVRTRVDLKVEVGDGSTLEVSGFATFFVIRGDSAQIPDELKARGFLPDTARWWIERWEDETLPPGGTGLRRAPGPDRAGATSARALSMGALKSYWRGQR